MAWALAAASQLTFVSERMVKDLGARRAEILGHLSRGIARMEATLDRSALGRTRGLDEAQRDRAAEQVLDALTNARKRHRARLLRRHWRHHPAPGPAGPHPGAAGDPVPGQALEPLLTYYLRSAPEPE